MIMIDYVYTHVSHIYHIGFRSAGFHPALIGFPPEDAERQRQEDAREEKTSPWINELDWIWLTSGYLT